MNPNTKRRLLRTLTVAQIVTFLTGMALALDAIVGGRVDGLTALSIVALLVLLFLTRAEQIVLDIDDEEARP